MKTKLQSVMWSMLLAAGLTAALPVVRAQDEGGEKPKKERAERPERPGGGGPAQRLEMMREHLGLTDAQVEQLKPILAAEREEVAAKRKELGKDADRAAMREAMQAIREKYRPQIEAVLTAEQREKLAAARERGPGGRSGPGGPGGGEGREGKKHDKGEKGEKGGGEG